MNKKLKALFLTLAISLTFATAATAVACNKGGDDSPFSSEENLIKLRFESGSIDVAQYETVALSYTAKGSLEAVQFTSSDETIVSVDQNGVITTKGVLGNATITATLEDVTATCVVSVVKSDYAPEIVLNEDEYTIESGETLEFTVETQWNKTVLDEDIVYAVAFAEDSQDSNLVVSVNGNTISVVGSENGKVNVIVSTTVRGIYTSKQFSVNVVSGALKIKPTSLIYTPAMGKYHADISTTAEIGEMANSLPLDFIVAKGSDVFEDAEISWVADNENVTVVGNSVVGQYRGVTTLTGTTTVGEETATIQILCNVVPPETHLEMDEIPTFEIADSSIKVTPTNDDYKTEVNETYVNFFGGVEEGNINTFRFEVTDLGLIGTLQNVELNGKQVSYDIQTGRGKTYARFARALFPKEASQLGRQQLVFNTDKVRYTMDVNLYTMIINDAEELDKMRYVADLGQTEWWDREGYQGFHSSCYYDGYFVLGNDISYTGTITSMTDTGSVWFAQGNTNDFSRGFKGVFDGQGYNIDGLTVGKNITGDNQSGGLFGYISKEGIVRNVSFTNATLFANNGFICAMGDGTIENVSVSYKKIGGDKLTESINEDNPRMMGTFFSFGAGTNAKVRNCLIDASAADITLETGWYNGTQKHNINLVGKATNVENVVAVCPNQDLLARSGADVTKLSFVELIEDTELCSKFDSSIWTTEVEGILMFKNQVETLDKDREINFLNVDESLVAGFDMVILTDNPYVSIEINQVDGATYENGKLIVTEAAFTKTVTLTATSLTNPEITATHNVYIDSFGTLMAEAPASSTTIYNTDLSLKLGENDWLGDKNYVYIGAHVVSVGDGEEEILLDRSKLVWGVQNVTVVTIKNDVREHFNLSLNLWYTAADVKDATEVEETVFKAGSNGSYAMSQGEYTDQVEKAEGFEKVSMYTSEVAWPTALDKHFFSSTNLSEYSDIWFAMRVDNGRFIFQTVTVPASGWVYFHFTQTSENVWVAEVTIDGKVYKHEFDVVDTTNSLKNMLYRSGWGNGFLIYNNNATPVNATTPTRLYSTEILGVKKGA